MAEATTAASWIGWVGELGVGEGKRETDELGVEREKRASREKREAEGLRERENGGGKREKRFLYLIIKKIINNII